MKTFTILIIYFLSLPLLSKDCTHTETSFKCVQFVKNYDADTLTFNIPHLHPLIGKNMSIRVYGVDTPEVRTKNACEKTKGIKAKNLVHNLLSKAKEIELRNVKKGKYFRIVAEVIFDGKSLSQILLNKKLAYAYFGKTKKDINWCNTRKISSVLNRKLR